MKILFISLGCDKNLADSETMLGLLASRGYQIVDTEEDADVIIVNTCCFIHDAMEESIETILQMAEYKKSGSLKALIVTGCMAERYREEITKEIPEVDAVLGTASYGHILDAVDGALAGQSYLKMEPLDTLPLVNTHRMVTTGGYYAYLKIAEGCDKHCTYCIIPKLRGNFRSVPMEHLLREAKQLADDGVKEIILVAQETTLYGKDLYGEKKLPELLRRLWQNQRYPLDPHFVLLSGGDYGRTDPDDQRGAEDLSLPGSSDSTRQRRRPEKDGAPYIKGGAYSYHFQDPGRNPGHHASHNADHRISGGVKGAA